MLGRKVRLGAYVALAALALSFVAPATAEETAEERYARFQLFTNCEPIDLVVEELSSDAINVGLTRESIQAAVESRLRAARLYDPSAYPYLYVNVHVVGLAFSSSVELRKPVFDAYSLEEISASTWKNSVTGTHGKDSNYITSSLSQNLDYFLLQFLRVNEEACAKR